MNQKLVLNSEEQFHWQGIQQVIIYMMYSQNQVETGTEQVMMMTLNLLPKMKLQSCIIQKGPAWIYLALSLSFTAGRNNI